MSVSQRALGAQPGTRLLTRARVVPLVLGLLALLLALLIVRDVFIPAAPAGPAVSTAAVTRGTIQTSVTGTGTVVPAQQQNVGFQETGQLAEVDVKPGDRVTRGQVLAKLDPTTFQLALQTAQNAVTTAQASLNNANGSNAVTVGQHALSNAQQSLSDTQASVNLTGQQDQQQLATDQQNVSNDQVNFGLAKCPNATSACGVVEAALAADQAKVNQDNNKIAADQLAGQKSINQANQAITTAQDNLSNASSQRPNSVASAQAALSNAQIQAQTAQRNLDNTTLTAPFDGTVMSVSGLVGESVAASGGATALAPGSTAPLPGASGTTSAASSGTGGTGGAGGGPFVVLSNVSTMEVVAPFAETDASQLQPNQQASVTFDAVTGLTLTGHVLSVATNATSISNVTNYYATLVLDSLDSRLKAGMTANANVVVQQAANVLTVPNSVITRIGGASFVTLLGRDGKTTTRVPVQTGVAGTTTTQVTSGLNLGDRVVRPTLTTGASPGTGGGLGGGGGRGGLGGGGGGGVRIGGG